jgi:dCTP deaminase
LPAVYGAVRIRLNHPEGSAQTSVLSDRSIREEIEAGRLVIDPWEERYLQPASVDLRLGDRALVFRNHRESLTDVKKDMTILTEEEEIGELKPFVLHPGEFVLGATHERVEIPGDVVGRLDGKSSLGRLGLIVHSTAGFVDPGFKGHLTLELTNISNLPITLYAMMPVSQISFMRLTTPANKPYGGGDSKYQGQAGPQPSKYYLNYQTGRYPTHRDQPLAPRPHRRRRGG